MVLTQNGRVLHGQGFVRQSGQVSFVVAFWLTDDGGTPYFFAGTAVRGFAGWSAQGRYEVVGNPVSGGAWTMASVPCIVC